MHVKPLEYWSMESKILQKQCRLLLLPLIAFQRLKVEGKGLLLKTLRTLDMGFGGSKLDLT